MAHTKFVLYSCCRWYLAALLVNVFLDIQISSLVFTVEISETSKLLPALLWRRRSSQTKIEGIYLKAVALFCIALLLIVEIWIWILCTFCFSLLFSLESKKFLPEWSVCAAILYQLFHIELMNCMDSFWFELPSSFYSEFVKEANT